MIITEPQIEALGKEKSKEMVYQYAPHSYCAGWIAGALFVRKLWIKDKEGKQ